MGLLSFLLPPLHGLMGTSETGIRECLAEEFSSIYVLNLLRVMQGYTESEEALRT